MAAISKCGTGNAPSYDDVDAIMLTQNGCKGTIKDPSVTTAQFPKGWFVSTFDCSTFWVFFWNNGLRNVATTYSQYDLDHSVGTFDLAATLNDARAVLKKDRFYDLYPRSLTITDTAWAVLSVKRCAVITRIKIYNDPSSSVPQDAATLRLFDDLRALVAGARKRKTSGSPKAFEQAGLFNP